MMTIHKLSAGDGYRYYTRETASGDAYRPVKNDLGDYYTADGNPPGVWMGAGAAHLGVSGTVTEEQMASLFGEGLHPNADAIIRSALDEGLSVAEATRRARLGRRYYRYDRSGPLTSQIQDAVEAFTARANREPDQDERRKLRARVGAIAFRADFGRSPRDSEELGRYITAQEAPAQQAVAGWDLVMRAPEDISKALFGLGDDAVCAAVVECHDQAVRETLGWIERHALATRTGINGVAQEDVAGGLIATRFRHYDNRLGEPLLHDHVVVSNKVRGMDGKWRSLDGKLLYAMGVAASETYNQRVVELVCQRLGLEAEEREVTPGKRPVMGIKGLDAGVLEPHSRRTRDIRRRLEELLRQYRQQHRSEPTTAVRAALIQQATLETRPGKKKRAPLAELRKQWRAAAVAAVGEDRVSGLLRTAQAAAHRPPADGARSEVNVAEAAQDVLAAVSEHRAVWGERHVLAETRRHLVRLTAGQGIDDGLVEAIVRKVLTDSLSISPPDLHRPFAPLQREDGRSIYRRKEADLYTSQVVLDAEARVLHAAGTQVIPALTRQRFDSVAASFPSLDPGQFRLAREFACADRLVVAGIGPAGSGKTTALQLVRAAVAAGGGRLVPLAPSSRAAKVLEDKLGVPSFTLHGWLAERERMADAAPHPGQSRRSSATQERYELRPGDVVIVDEAGMAGSQNLARVVAQAEAAGALVRLIGDPFQLGSIESGGLLRQISRDIGAVELEQLHRFDDPAEAAATLVLRDGDPADAWRWYVEQDRVLGGTHEEMLDAVFTAWRADTERGVETVMMADSAESVRELNARAQATQLAADRIDMRRTAALRDEFQAGIGDLIVTRKNQRRLAVQGQHDHVKNGDQWLIEAIDGRGAVRARHTGHGGRVVLPPGYVGQHAELGYALTVHRAQGLTARTAHGLITATTSRESAYVMATRGEAANHVYVVTDGSGHTMHDVLETVARSSQAAISAHDTIRDEQNRAYSIGQLAAEYTDAHARASSARIQALTRRVLGGSAEMFIGAEAWGVLERSIRAAEQEGWDLGRLVADAFAERDFHDAEDPSAVLAWRIDNRVEGGVRAARRAAVREAEPGRSRPLKWLSGEQLQRLVDLAQQHRRAALEELHRADAAVDNQPRPVVAGGLPHPAWPLRPRGHLTGAQLAEALSTARAAARRALDQDRDARTAAVREEALLRREQKLRRSMTPRDRRREDWQREPRPGASHTAHQPVDVTIAELNTNLYRQDDARERLARAEVIASTIAAEQRLRRRLPHGPAHTPDHAGPLPDWLAPADAIRHADTPEGWRQYLVERRLVLSQRLTEMGRVLAQEQPGWTRSLGPVPPADKSLREGWERTAALAEAWRLRHGVDESEDGIGEQPAEARDKQAWTILRERVAAVGRRARATDSALRRAQDPTSGIRIAARTAEAIQQRLLQARLADAGDREDIAAAAHSFAALALERSQSGAEPAEEWVEQIPSPPADDNVQAEQWRHLVAAVDTYRLVNGLDSPAPLGETSSSGTPDERDELQAALTLYQRSRTQQRLDEIRSLRGARQDGGAQQAGEEPDLSASQRHHEQHQQRPSRRPGRGVG